MRIGKPATAERVSCEASDNFVFQRSVLAYAEAAKLISGEVLEIGTGTGYGTSMLAQSTARLVTIDKHHHEGLSATLPANVEYLTATVPPLPFGDASFDCVVSFQVIEHIVDDRRLVSEISRVLRPGGLFVVTTPNAPMSLTRNPWHVREYRAGELKSLLESGGLTCTGEYGIAGNERVMEYYENNRRSVRRITRFDIFDLQHRLPRRLLQLPYDILNRINRRRLLAADESLTLSIGTDDYRLQPVTDDCFDLFFTARKQNAD